MLRQVASKDSSETEQLKHKGGNKTLVTDDIITKDGKLREDTH